MIRRTRIVSWLQTEGSQKNKLDSPVPLNTIYLCHGIFLQPLSEKRRSLILVALFCFIIMTALLSPIRGESGMLPIIKKSINGDNIRTAKVDKRSYRWIQLPNNLEVLLVHDPTTDKASAAMDVHVGSL